MLRFVGSTRFLGCRTLGTVLPSLVDDEVLLTLLLVEAGSRLAVPVGCTKCDTKEKVCLEMNYGYLIS